MPELGPKQTPPASDRSPGRLDHRSEGTVGPSRALSGSSRSRRRLSREQKLRAGYSAVGIAIVLAIGTLGFELIARLGSVDAFYFESMLATGQGPPFPLNSSTAKLFASGMAFVSVGTVLTTLLVNLGPTLGRLWREGIADVEHAIERLESENPGDRRGPR